MGHTYIYTLMLDDICRYCIYTVYFICRDSLCWLTGCVKLAREICFWSEWKHVIFKYLFENIWWRLVRNFTGCFILTKWNINPQQMWGPQKLWMWLLRGYGRCLKMTLQTPAPTKICSCIWGDKQTVKHAQTVNEEPHRHLQKCRSFSFQGFYF
jgi:hypothetical protein